MRIYTELASWYPLLTPRHEYEQEGTEYRDHLLHHLGPGAHELLELGCGAGHNAWYLGPQFRCTLTDLSPQMLDLARKNLPDATFHAGDMRTLRLHRQFDAILVHDAIDYMTTRDDLRAVARTVAVHLKPHGAALLAPDHTKESFEPATESDGSDGDDGRALRYLMWTWDPDPMDETAVVDFTIVMRTGTDLPELVHDRHVVGLFPQAVWHEAFADAGLVLTPLEREGGYPCWLARHRT